jgi:hypothetical protein
MRFWHRPPGPAPAKPPSVEGFSDIGSQLEDLVTHVMRCERWARFEDRLDLAVAVERSRTVQLRARRADGGGSA